jgi:CheY-like chemotaxis protein
MKRARKSPVSPDLIPDPTSVSGLESVREERLLWISFTSKAQREDEHTVSELDWVRTRLEAHFPVDELTVTQSSEAPKQISQYLEQRDLGRLSNPQVPTRVFVSSLSRSDPVVEIIAVLKRCLPNCVVNCVLGQWWVGHKRTQPLPPLNSVTYWYELYDLLLPDLKEQNQTPILSELRKQEPVAFESALICSDNPELRRMWSELLQQHGIHPVALIDFNAIPESDFSYVLVDTDFYNPEIAAGTCNLQDERLSLVATLRKRFPKAVIATLMGFPQWPPAQSALESGSDIVAGKPCRITGLISSLRSFAAASNQ